MIMASALRYTKPGVIIFVLFLLSLNTLYAQNEWDEKAKTFVSSTAKNRYKLSIAEVRSSVETSSSFISTYCKTCSPGVLSSLYLARANLRMYVLEWEEDSIGDAYTPSPALVSNVKLDFLKTQEFCQECKCSLFDNMMGFYGRYGSKVQFDSLERKAKATGKPAEHSYLGLNLNYIPQQSIAAVEIGLLNAATAFQPKKFIDANGKKYRQCKYEYPMAVGLFFVGYETSFNDAHYQAAKLDPIWLNYFFSIHPLQLIYAGYKGTTSLVYRPEIGLSFSSLSVNYALNIPFNASFGFYSQHNISIRFCIPAIKLN